MKKLLPIVVAALVLIATQAFGATAYRYNDSVTTLRGDAVGGASVTVYLAGTTTKATIYLYGSTAVEKSNPTYTDGYGRYFFYAEPGLYDLTIAGSNVITYTVEDVRVFSDAGYTYNVVDYGAIPDDDVDDAAAIRAAVAAADAADGGTVVFPDGVFDVASTITLPSPITVSASGYRTTQIKPSITDSSAVFYILNGTGIRIEGLNIDSGKTRDDPQQCIGIHGDTNTRRSFIEARFAGLETGLKLRGWQNRVNMYSTQCALGFEADEFNACTLDLQSDDDIQGFAINSGIGIEITASVQGSGDQVPCTVDSATSVNFNSLYFEWDDAAGTPTRYLTVGGTSPVCSVMFGSLFSALNRSTDCSILLDDVRDVSINGWINAGQNHSGIKTTSNTKNVRFLGHITNGFLQDLNGNFMQAVNVWPNPRFDLWFRGWDSYSKSSGVASIAKETTIVRSGKNAAKITMGSGETSGFVNFNVTSAGTGLALNLRGKTVLFGAWVYIPEATFWDGEATGGLPQILAISDNGSATVTSTFDVTGSNINTYYQKGTWHLYLTQLVVQSDATTVTLRVYPTNSGAATPDANQYIVVDDVFCLEGGWQQKYRAENGLYSDSPQNPVAIVNNKMSMRVDAYPTDADFTYEVGDQIVFMAPTAGGYIGKVCTTAGTGATSTWKDFGAVAP
jgi:hypothetical protein